MNRTALMLHGYFAFSGSRSAAAWYLSTAASNFLALYRSRASLFSLSASDSGGGVGSLGGGFGAALGFGGAGAGSDGPPLAPNGPPPAIPPSINSSKGCIFGSENSVGSWRAMAGLDPTLFS